MDVIKYYPDLNGELDAINVAIARLKEAGNTNPAVKNDADDLIVRLESLAAVTTKVMAYGYGLGMSESQFTDACAEARANAQVINLKAAGAGVSPVYTVTEMLKKEYSAEGRVQAKVMDVSPAQSKDVYVELSDSGLAFGFPGAVMQSVKTEGELFKRKKENPNDELLVAVTELIATIRKANRAKKLVRTVVTDFVKFIVTIKGGKEGVEYSYVPSSSEVGTVAMSEGEFCKFGASRVMLEMSLIAVLDHQKVLVNTANDKKYDAVVVEVVEATSGETTTGTEDSTSTETVTPSSEETTTDSTSTATTTEGPASTEGTTESTTETTATDSTDTTSAESTDSTTESTDTTNTDATTGDTTATDTNETTDPLV